MALIAGVLGRAGERGQMRRKADAADGIRTWDPREDVEKFILKDTKAKKQAREDALGRREGEEEPQDMSNEALRQVFGLASHH